MGAGQSTTSIRAASVRKYVVNARKIANDWATCRVALMSAVNVPRVASAWQHNKEGGEELVFSRLLRWRRFPNTWHSMFGGCLTLEHCNGALSLIA